MQVLQVRSKSAVAAARHAAPAKPGWESMVLVLQNNTLLDF